MRTCSRAKTLSRWLEAGVHSGALFLLSLMATAQGQDFTYTDSNGAITITGGNVSGNIVMPNTIVGLPVVAIGYRAFFLQSRLTGVVIPNTVSNIGSGAFGNCVALTNFLMPDSVSTL